jgi:hypothetical protein
MKFGSGWGICFSFLIPVLCCNFGKCIQKKFQYVVATEKKKTTYLAIIEVKIKPQND